MWTRTVSKPCRPHFIKYLQNISLFSISPMCACGAQRTVKHLSRYTVFDFSQWLTTYCSACFFLWLVCFCNFFYLQTFTNTRHRKLFCTLQCPSNKPPGIKAGKESREMYYLLVMFRKIWNSYNYPLFSLNNQKILSSTQILSCQMNHFWQCCIKFKFQ